MSYLPSEIILSKATTNKFALIKQRTGITPNLMGRVALMKSLESYPKLPDLKPMDHQGQRIPKDIFFGDDSDIYELAIELYVNENRFEGDIKELLNMLVEHGAHSIPIVKTLSDLDSLKKE